MWVILGAGPAVGRSSEVWKFSFETCKWEQQLCKGDIPSARDGHSTTYIGNGRIVVFGGQGVPYLNDGKSEKITETLKVKTLFVREVLNNLYQFDCNTLTWTAVEIEGAAMPMGRRSHIASVATVPLRHLGYSRSELDESLAKHAHAHGHNNHHPHHAHTHASAAHGGVHEQSSVHSHGHFGHSSDGGAHPPPHPAHHHSHADSDSAGPHVDHVVAPAEDIGPTEKVLLVFGGSGIEPSKYTEVIFNDLWAFSLTRGRWSRLNPDGIKPRAVFDHRCELIGDHTLVVMGGIASIETQSKARPGFGAGSTAVSDVMLLDTFKMSWSYQPLIDMNGRPAKLAVHGHSLVSCWKEGTNNNGVMYIYGGKEVVDIKAAASMTAEVASKKKRIPPPRHPIWQFELFSRGTVTALPISGTLLPENRYGHIAVPWCPMEDQWKEPKRIIEASQLPATKEKHGAGHGHHWGGNRRGAVRPTPENHDETLMVMFGGTNIDVSGFCDPVVYRLVKVFSYVDAMILEAEASGITRSEAPVLTAQSLSISLSTKSQMSDSGDAPSARNDMSNRRLSIWDRKKLQLKSSMTTEKTTLKNPETWAELKVCLSYPLHERNATADSSEQSRGSPTKQRPSFDDQQLFGGMQTPNSFGGSRPSSPIKSIHEFGNRFGFSSVGGGSMSMTSIQQLSRTRDAETPEERRNRIKSHSASLLPKIKSRLPLHEIREGFLRQQTPKYLLEHIEPYGDSNLKYGSISSLTRQLHSSRSASASALLGYPN